MKKLKRFLAGVLCAAALAGCAAPAAQNSDQEGSTAASTETETSQPTAPADSGAADVTCLGSYTGAADDTQVAAMGQEGLTNRQLAVWYLLTGSEAQNHLHLPLPDPLWSNPGLNYLPFPDHKMDPVLPVSR